MGLPKFLYVLNCVMNKIITVFKLVSSQVVHILEVLGKAESFSSLLPKTRSSGACQSRVGGVPPPNFAKTVGNNTCQ